MMKRVLFLLFLSACGCASIAQGNVVAIRRNFIDPSAGIVLVAAHRAPHARYPENPPDAIKEGIELGVDIVEIDVKFSKDGVPFLMHDHTLDRTTTGKGEAGTYAWEELQKVFIVDKGTITPFKIPSPAEALKTASGHIMADLDLSGRAGCPMISAHRGASLAAPENTLAAYKSAIEMGADFIEIDVRTTADGEQVCLHDASLKRTTGLDAAVGKVTLKRIKKLSAGRWFGADHSGEKVPSLEEVCQLAARSNRSRQHQVHLYVDCKDIRPADLVRVLEEYQLLDSAVFYGNINTLRSIRKLAPSARLLPAYPPGNQVEGVIAELDPFAFDVPWAELTSGLVKECHKKGVRVFCDLLGENDTVSNYRKAIQFEIDLIQTDDVKSVKDIIMGCQNVKPK